MSADFGLPPMRAPAPMPPCKPHKQENLGEYKALKKMLEHFKEKNDLNNKSLADFGERGVLLSINNN